MGGFKKMKLKNKLFNTFKELLRKIFFFRLCVGRFHSYIDLPLDYMKDFMIAFTFFKVYYPNMDYMRMIPLFLVIICITTYLGYLDIKYKLAHLQTSVNNSINPELMTIYKNTARSKKK